ncbi:hypothetical protein DFP72DRAFT_1083231 [Ephemerocybe angulata]|uniref:Uncharacterized protein n=1 Tax=Ephemerocybe angulata TaxID=980116 RepID=A0A8H6H9D6_9AGAR|nr:hypothetical protein DFP72DRAFT_1083231 [Tulosesus angulatus]
MNDTLADRDSVHRLFTDMAKSLNPEAKEEATDVGPSTGKRPKVTSGRMKLGTIVTMEASGKSTGTKVTSLQQISKRKAEVKSEASTTRLMVRRAPTNDIKTGAARVPRSRGAESLLTNLTSTLDPNVQAARAEERSARGMQATQNLSLSSQLRETQYLIENFRFQLSDAERRCAAAERRADKYEMMAMIQRPQPQYQVSRREPLTPACSVRQDIHYPDGGALRPVGPPG